MIQVYVVIEEESYGWCDRKRKLEICLGEKKSRKMRGGF